MTEADAGEGRITTETRGALMLIAIDRPAKLNGFTPAMLRGLAEAYSKYENNGAARCAVLHAIGDHFTAGLDLPKVAPLIAKGESLFPDGAIDPFGLRAPKRTKPLVVAVQGWCLTLGIELMLAADIVVAASDTRFAQIEVKRGLMPTGGATLRMVERAGWGNAMKYLLTGDEFDAAEALRLGFVQEVVETGAQLDRALEYAATIAAQAPMAVRDSLLSARTAVEHGPDAAVADFRETQLKLVNSEDAKEGLAAFKERRVGNFTGR